ncbi:MAG TPA: ABC transporter ATP-binding protein [Actinomycetes bacterium]|jgi:ABC-2 type transport system ATP-binding protein|nr:ABC transporter ATP-binding protein [Actinomycetota bacterium]HEX2157261.1 ABC transporter ATP-binding protein [Actinomycetes bacterium]
MTVVLEATGLGKRYRRTWALRDCSVAVPEGRVVALVGPNGAGKSTLLHLAVGLLGPSAGEVRVFGAPAASGPETLGRVGFLAQDKPLYHGFTVAEMLRFGARLNPRWDQAEADRWLERFDLPPGRRVGQLSGGQRTQLALALALAKRPRLLLLDEPMADLDPLVRHDLTRLLMETVAAEGLTVVFSSHVLAELATVCDYLVLLATGRVQLAGDTDELLAGHKLLVGPLRNPPRVGPHQVVEASHTDRQTTLLVRTAGPVHDPSWAVHDVGLEQLVLAYMRHPETTTLPRPSLAAVPSDAKEVSA